jgi:hypothetical protein
MPLMLLMPLMPLVPAIYPAVQGMRFFSEDTRSRFEHALEWLGEWACSRSYGLGTRCFSLHSHTHLGTDMLIHNGHTCTRGKEFYIGAVYPRVSP